VQVHSDLVREVLTDVKSEMVQSQVPPVVGVAEGAESMTGVRCTRNLIHVDGKVYLCSSSNWQRLVWPVAWKRESDGSLTKDGSVTRGDAVDCEDLERRLLPHLVHVLVHSVSLPYLCQIAPADDTHTSQEVDSSEELLLEVDVMAQ